MMEQKTMLAALAVVAFLACGLAHAGNESWQVPSPQECAEMGFTLLHPGDLLDISDGSAITYSGDVFSFPRAAMFYPGRYASGSFIWVPIYGQNTINYSNGDSFNISLCGDPIPYGHGPYDICQDCWYNYSIYAQIAEQHASKHLGADVLNISGHTYRFEGGYACAPSPSIKNCIVVTAPNVTIDCNGGTISSSLETPMVAIYSNQSGTVVKNCRFEGFAGGISIVNASGSVLGNNTFANEVNSMHESVKFAIQANSSTGIVVANNTVLLMDHSIIAEDQGLTFFTSIVENGVNDSSFYGNDLDPSLAGVYALNSHGNSFTANKASSLMLFDSSSTSIKRNTFSYVFTSPNATIIDNVTYRSGGWAQIFLVRSNGNAVSGNIAGLGNSGEFGIITLYNSNGNTVENNSIQNGSMAFSASSGNTVSGNNVTQGYEYGNTLEIGTTINSSTGNVFSGNNLASKSASSPVIFTTSCIDPYGNPTASQAANNTFFHNTISGALWVAEECPLPLNSYSYEGQGNAYYLPNGTPSWDVYDIIDTNNDSYADVGSDLPFTQSTVGAYWHGPSEDAHPYTLKQGALLEISGNASTAANQTREEQPPAPPSEAVALPQAIASPAEPATPPIVQPTLLDGIFSFFGEITQALQQILNKPATLVAAQPPAKGCGCGILNVSNSICNVTHDLITNGTCFDVRANNVTIQCNGHQISGISGAPTVGVVSVVNNATVVENCRLNRITSGISFGGVYGGRIENITAKSDALGTSIQLASSSHNVISGISVYAVGTGLDLDGSDYNNLTNIYLESSYGKPLLLLNSGNNRLSNVSGTTTYNQAGVFIAPITLQHSGNNTLDGCKGSAYGEGWDGAPGIVLQGSSNNIISNTIGISPGDVGFVLESGSNGNKLINCSASGFFGLEVRYSNGNTLDGFISSGFGGIRGSNGTIINSSRFSASGDAFALTDSKNSIVANNTFNSTGGTALDLLSMFGSCTGNQFVNNTLISSGGLLDLNAGLQLPGLQSANNTFYWNNFTATAGFYIKDLGSGNRYSAEINGMEEGNIYANILDGSVQVQGNKPSGGFPALFIGINGTGYPYDASASQGKIIGNAVDSAPLTPFSRAMQGANRIQPLPGVPGSAALANSETAVPVPAAQSTEGAEK